MEKAEELSPSPLDALLDAQDVSDTDETILATIQKIEAALGPQKWYGDLPYVFSRNNRDDIPNNEHWLHGWKTTRLLDKPSITNDLIQRTILHVERKFKNVVGSFGGIKRARPHLEHRINAQKYRQKVTLLSYLIRSFCPDTTQAVIPHESIYLTDEDTMAIIRALPLDPDKLSDEVLEKIGLAPHDYETYTLQARRRYKLWIRERFFEMMSEADVFSFDIGPQQKKSTARILRFRDTKGDRKIGSFINTSSLHIHTTPAQRVSRHKIMDTHFRVFESSADFKKSQSHALEKIVKKWGTVGFFQDAFENYAQLSHEGKDSLLLEASEYFSEKHGFHEQRLIEFISRIAQTPQMVGNVVRVLYDLDHDLTGKYHELREVLRLFRIIEKRKKK